MLSNALLLLVLLGPVFSLSINAPRQSSPTVTLSYGTFQGTSARGLDGFFGMPFAQAERFGLPQPPTMLTGVQQAVAFGPACPQQSFGFPVTTTPPTFGSPAAQVSSEDCLFVNVIRPSGIAPGVKLPVVFWIYGGAFEIGDTFDFDGSTVVARSITLGEPIIYVSANYRLHALGFLASKEVKAAGFGNLGLRDQRFAMQWVQTHIANFGGDPAKVTLWEQSAGAISVGLQFFINHGNPEGLFRGAVMNSGSPLPLPDITTGQGDYDQLVTNTNCMSSTDTLACLKQVPLATFQSAVDQSRSIASFTSLNLAWWPRVDGDFITDNPVDSVPKGAYARVPFIAGNCDDEGTEFSLVNLNLTTDQEAVDYLHHNYLPGASDEQFQTLATLYPSDPTQGSPFDTGLTCQLTPEFKRIAAFQGDYLLQAPRRAFIQAAAKTQNTWGFLYKRGKDSLLCFGSSHTSDLPDFYGQGLFPDFQGTDALVNFVNNLDPNTVARNTLLSTLIAWPKYSTNTSAPPLLTFVDPTLFTLLGPHLVISPDTYRAAGMKAFANLFRFYV